MDKSNNHLIIGGQNVINCIDLEVDKLIFTYENSKYSLTTNIIVKENHFFVFTDISVVQIVNRNGSLQMVSNTTFYYNNQRNNKMFQRRFEQILCIISFDDYLFASEGSYLGNITIKQAYENDSITKYFD